MSTGENRVIEAVKEAARRVLPGYDMVAAYLYGSYAQGEEHGGSDVDIALYLEDYDVKKLLELGRRLREETGIDRELDVRALNRTGPEFSFGVIRDGEVIYEADRTSRIDIEQGIERRYHNMKPLIDEYRAEMKRRISQDG